MSDYLAVAGVTAVLKWILNDAPIPNGPGSLLSTGPGITTTAPDLVTTGGDEPPQLNLFMYYASLNPAFRNVGLPALDSQGRRLTNPPLALNLHYLVSAYGKNEFDAEILLAWAMLVFHQNPVISQQDIVNKLQEIKLSPSPSAEITLLLNTNLASQVESIKITPASLSNEEIARLWMAFQTHYRPTTAYEVSVVLIQNPSAVKANLPVQSRHVLALPSPVPVIDNVTPGAVLSGGLLTLLGRNFLGDRPADTLAQFDDAVPVAVDAVQNTSVRISAPDSLAAGVHTLRVCRQVSFGIATDPHHGFSSNPVQFLLLPALVTPPATAAVNTTVAFTVNPAVGWQQRVALMIGNNSLPLPPRPPGNPVSVLNFLIPPDFPHTNPPVALPLRIEIDGVQSPLTVDANSGNPTFGQFLPQLAVSGP